MIKLDLNGIYVGGYMIEGSSETLSTEDFVGVGILLCEAFDNYCIIILAALMFDSSSSSCSF